jgi:hypothetical protein
MGGANLVLDGAGRVKSAEFDLPAGVGTENSAAHAHLELLNFGVPVNVEPPESRSSITLREYLARPF